MNKKIKGSGILVVIFCAIAFFIYTMTTFSQKEYYNILQNKYEKNIIQEYEKNIDDIEDFYIDVYMRYKE